MEDKSNYGSFVILSDENTTEMDEETKIFFEKNCEKLIARQLKEEIYQLFNNAFEEEEIDQNGKE